jgi:transcriptional regulator with XRE-family HTH domain
MENPNIIENLNYHQKRLNLSGSALAAEIKISERQLSRWKKQENPVQEKYFEKIAKALCIDVETLTERMPDEAPSLGRNNGTQPFTCRVSQKSANGFSLIKSKFGLSKSEVVEWAPALFYLVAAQAIEDLQRWVDRYNENVANAPEGFAPNEDYYYDHINKLEMLNARDVFGKLYGRTHDEARIPFVEAFINLAKKQRNELSPEYSGDRDLEGHLPEANVRLDLETCKKLARGDESLASAIQDGHFINADTMEFERLSQEFSNLRDQSRAWVHERRREYYIANEEASKRITEQDKVSIRTSSGKIDYTSLLPNDDLFSRFYVPKQPWLLDLWHELDDDYGEWIDD